MPKIVSALLLFIAVGGSVCLPEPALSPDAPVTNPVAYSQNRRYCVVERWYEGLEDFKTERAGALGLDLPGAAEPVGRKNLTFAIYETDARRKLGEITVPINHRWRMMVSDSGRYVVLVQVVLYDIGCRAVYATADETFVMIVRTDGTIVGRLKVGDVLTEDDIASGPRDGVPLLRHESDTDEVLVLSIEGKERRVDLATAKLLDPKVDILPRPAVVADAAPRALDYDSQPFDDRSAVRVSSKELLAQAIDAPLPPFPSNARVARLERDVWVQVVVSYSGEVVALRSTPDDYFQEAAVKSLRQWRFRPLSVNGRHVRFTGEVAVHFAMKAAP